MERLQNIPKELISNTLNLDYRTPVSKAASYLKKYSAIVISKDKEYCGILDTRTIYRTAHGMTLNENEKVERFAIKAPKITNSTSIYDIIAYFYKSGVKALPYMSGNKIVGVLERKTLLKVILSLNVLEDMKVSESMTTPVLAIDANANLAQANASMRDNKVNRLVVLQNSRFVGLITNYDIVGRYMTKTGERLPEFKTDMYRASNVPISSVMERNTHTVEYNRTMSEAVRLMVEDNISSLIVLRKGNPIGILTITDVMESIIARQKVEASKVFMSGFDANTYQYEDEAREELTSLISHVERLSGIDVDYVTFKVKRTHSKLYEMQIRLSLGRHGIISMNTTQYLFDDALASLLKRLKHKVVKEKESILTHRKVNTLRDVTE